MTPTTIEVPLRDMRWNAVLLRCVWWVAAVIGALVAIRLVIRGRPWRLIVRRRASRERARSGIGRR